MAKKISEKEQEIHKNMEVLAISREEAEELYSYDHDEADCPEADALTDKAEQVTKDKKKGSALDKVRNLKAKKKTDESKEAIVTMVFDAVRNSTMTAFPQEMTGTKMSFMDLQGNFYSVAITKHKAAPDGFKGVE